MSRRMRPSGDAGSAEQVEQHEGEYAVKPIQIADGAVAVAESALDGVQVFVEVLEVARPVRRAQDEVDRRGLRRRRLTMSWTPLAVFGSTFDSSAY